MSPNMLKNKARHLVLRRLQYIEDACAEKNITRKDLALHIGLDPQVIESWYEDGASAHMLDLHLVQLADFFDIEIELLYTGRNPIQKNCEQLIENYLSLTPADRAQVDKYVSMLLKIDQERHGVDEPDGL